MADPTIPVPAAALVLPRAAPAAAPAAHVTASPPDPPPSIPAPTSSHHAGSRAARTAATSTEALPAGNLRPHHPARPRAPPTTRSRTSPAGCSPLPTAGALPPPGRRQSTSTKPRQQTPQAAAGGHHQQQHHHQRHKWLHCVSQRKLSRKMLEQWPISPL